MDNSWLIKGVAFLLIAISLGIILWLVRQKPKKITKRRKVVRPKITAPRRKTVTRKRVVKRKTASKKRKPGRRARKRP